MIRSLRTGVSGLKSHQTRMDVVGNNIANVNTIAFKRGRTAFNEVLGQEMLGVGRTAGGTGINPSTVGLGVSLGSIDQNWSQGSLETTGVKTDLALNGDGFFIAKAGDRQMLTRAGNFTFNRNGEFVTANGLNVQGWAFNDKGNIASGELQDVKIDLNATAPAKVTERIAVGGNLSAEAKNAVTSEAFIEGRLDSAAGAGTAGFTASTEIFDETGAAQALDVRFTATANPDEWTVEYQVAGGGWNNAGAITAGATPSLNLAGINNGRDVSLNLTALEAGAGSTGSLTQNADPEEVQTITSTAYDAKGEGHTVLIDFYKTGDNEWLYELRDADTGASLTGAKEPLVFNPDGSIDPAQSSMDSLMNQPFTWDIDGDGQAEEMTLNFGSGNSALTQYSGSTTATVQEQDGYASGTLAGYSITPEGVLELNFTNGEQQKLFQLGIGTVNNPGGLEQQGDNFYTTSSASGDLQLGRAGRDVRTAVVAGTLEMSNVDLATEFTDMIVAQRGYQASARVITTSDELMQETVQLKR